MQKKYLNFISSLIIIIFGCMLFSSCAGLQKEVSPAKPWRIENVALSQKTFNPSKNQKVKIKYRLNHPAYVTVNIYNSDNHWIDTLLQDEYQPAGYNTITWDGRDSQGKIVPDEAYIYTLLAKDPKTGQEFLYDPADATTGFELQEIQGEFDRATGQISYLLPKAARVRIRLGVAKGPLLNNFLHWQPQEAGRHTLLWDGKDTSGNFKFSRHPELRIFFTAFTLADNSIITQGNSQPQTAYQPPGGRGDRVARKEPPKLVLHQHQHNQHTHHTHKEDVHKPARPYANSHSNHTRSQCQEPQIQVSFPGQTQNKASRRGQPISRLKGKIPVRISIAAEDRERLIRERFGIAIFIDYVFFYEDLDAVSPYTYYLDTTHLNPGEHILSISIESYEDHIGTESRLIQITKDKNEHTS